MDIQVASGQKIAHIPHSTLKGLINLPKTLNCVKKMTKYHSSSKFNVDRIRSDHDNYIEKIIKPLSNNILKAILS